MVRRYGFGAGVQAAEGWAAYLASGPQRRHPAHPGAVRGPSTLAGWAVKASFHLSPVVYRLAWHLFMDETRVPVLGPGRGKTKTGYLWALARDRQPWSGPDAPGVAFFNAPGCGGRHAVGFLDGFQGTLHVDGYTGNNAVAAPGKWAARSYCWAHARCKLCGIEDSHLSLVVAFGLWLRRQRARDSPKSRLGEKRAHIGNHWDGLEVFLDDGRVKMDNKVVENAVWPLALNRKNALFAGFDEGAADKISGLRLDIAGEWRCAYYWRKVSIFSEGSKNVSTISNSDFVLLHLGQRSAA